MIAIQNGQRRAVSGRLRITTDDSANEAQFSAVTSHVMDTGFFVATRVQFTMFVCRFFFQEAVLLCTDELRLCVDKVDRA